jgi:hypothetical protein
VNKFALRLLAEGQTFFKIDQMFAADHANPGNIIALRSMDKY